MADTVWLARHGNRQDFADPEWHLTAERPYDPGLSPDGIVQAQRLAERMTREEISALFSSPFLRTAETAHHIAEALDLPIFLEPGLSEWMNPDWLRYRPKTLSAEELAEHFPRIDLRYESSLRASYPETEPEAMRRAAEAAHSIMRSSEGPVLLVGHGVSVHGAAVGLDAQAVVTTCGLCSLFKLVRNENDWRMELCGDVTHLDAAVAADRLPPAESSVISIAARPIPLWDQIVYI